MGTNRSGEHIHTLEAKLDITFTDGRQEVAYDTQPMALLWDVILGGPIGSPIGFGWRYDLRLDKLTMWSPRLDSPKIRMELHRISSTPIEPDFPAMVVRYRDDGSYDVETEQARQTGGEQDAADQESARSESKPK